MYSEIGRFSNVNLKPCPFCGGTAHAYYKDYWEDGESPKKSDPTKTAMWVRCDCCWAQTGASNNERMNDMDCLMAVTEKWNRRANE